MVNAFSKFCQFHFVFHTFIIYLIILLHCRVRKIRQEIPGIKLRQSGNSWADLNRQENFVIANQENPGKLQ